MNFKSTSLCLLSISLLAQSPNVLAAKKSALEEVKELQAALLKNKNSINNLLITKAHNIPKETENLISNPGNGAHSTKTPLSSAIRLMSLEAVKDGGGRDELFKGPDAMANLLKGFRMAESDKAEQIVNPTEKVYSITVLNPQQLEVMKKTNDEFTKALGQGDDFLTRMSKYMELVIKGERFITFKQAEDLSNQIFKMNQDLETVEELAIKLPAKEQQAVEAFRKNMSEFLNKKLVFTEINKVGFTAHLDIDVGISLVRNYIPVVALNKDYSNDNIAKKLKESIILAVQDRNSTRWDDFRLRSDSNTEMKVSSKDLNDLKVLVSADRLKTTIYVRKSYINGDLQYPRLAKLSFVQNGKELYNHESENQENYYNPNNALVRAQLQIVKGYEIQMNSMYKEFGHDNFGVNLGKVELISK